MLWLPNWKCVESWYPAPVNSTTHTQWASCTRYKDRGVAHCDSLSLCHPPLVQMSEVESRSCGLWWSGPHHCPLLPHSDLHIHIAQCMWVIVRYKLYVLYILTCQVLWKLYVSDLPISVLITSVRVEFKMVPSITWCVVCYILTLPSVETSPGQIWESRDLYTHS